MDDLPGLLARDFGFRAQGKAAPMAASKSTTGGPLNFGIDEGRSSSFSSSSTRPKSTWNSTPPVGNSFPDDDNGLFKSSAGLGGYDDVYGGPPKYSNRSKSSSTSFDYDAMFEGSKDAKSSMPVYDKPLYDDDIFDGVPGMKSTSSVNYDDVFTSVSSPPKQNDHFDDLLGNLGKNEPRKSNSSFPRSSEEVKLPKQNDHYDDFLGNLGKNEPPQSRRQFHKSSEEVNNDVSDFDDLLPGFGGSSPSKNRGTPETSQPHQSNVPSSVLDDPFVIIEPGSVPAYETSEIFSDPLEQLNKPNKPANTKFNSLSGRGVFEDVDPRDGLAKPIPSSSSGVKIKVEDKSPPRTGATATSTRRAATEEPTEDPFFGTAKNASAKVSVNNNRKSHRPSLVEVSPKSEYNMDSADDIWITVSEVPLYTQLTSAPPPSRPPPPRPVQVSNTDNGSFSARHAKDNVNEYSSFQQFSPSFQSPPTAAPSFGRTMGVSSVDELEDFVSGRSRDRTDDRADVLSSEEEVDTNSAAAAMKEAMDRAEAKFKHAREVRERESARTGRSRDVAQQEKDEKALRDAQERELREKQEKLDREREQREKEEKERERRRLEKEREQARQVVERATREARERAAAEARQKSQKEARERAERVAVQRAHAEARERAATEAKERAERAASEAKERSNAEARERAAAGARAETEVRLRAERASVERAAAEARERAAAEARERAAAAASAKAHHQNNENDLESFFNMGSRASSAPRPNRTTTSESAFDSQFQNRPTPARTSAATSSSIRKASSTTNIVDDLTSIFGGTPPAGQFQDIDGESEERRRARLERHQRTQERTAKALAEKNERDLQTQRDQEERHKFAETLDFEIKRWSAGKEGNLRALLSTLQYVLWPECGWQQVSLTDLITTAAVKKVYRKATLCIHPDKVQQKGANNQQRYIAEKVFDLLKEAWNKLNSEELY